MVSMHNERPVCFCEFEDCPAGCPIAFAPLDVRFPPTFCKFCSTRFDFEESDTHPPPIKGYGKGDIGKGKRDREKGKGKGKGKERSTSVEKRKPYDAYPKQQQAKSQAPNANNMEGTMNWLASLGLKPEVLMMIARAAHGSLDETSAPAPKQVSPLQKLKAECRQAESVYRITQNNVKQAFVKSKKIAEELETQNLQILTFLSKEKELRIAWQLAIDKYDAAELSKQKQYDQ